MGEPPDSQKKLPELTPRERDVLSALCQPALENGAFNEPASIRDIAIELEVTEAAVKQHLLRLYDKFEIHEGGMVEVPERYDAFMLAPFDTTLRRSRRAQNAPKGKLGLTER